MRSVAVRHETDPRRPTLIRGDRYDPARHVLWGEDGPEDGPRNAKVVGTAPPEPEAESDGA